MDDMCILQSCVFYQTPVNMLLWSVNQCHFLAQPFPTTGRISQCQKSQHSVHGRAHSGCCLAMAFVVIVSTTALGILPTAQLWHHFTHVSLDPPDFIQDSNFNTYQTTPPHLSSWYTFSAVRLGVETFYILRHGLSTGSCYALI